MKPIILDTVNLEASNLKLRHTLTKYNHVNADIQKLCSTQTTISSTFLHPVMKNSNILAEAMNNLHAYVQNSIHAYREVDQRIQQKSKQLDANVSNRSSKFFDWKPSGSFKFDHDFSLKKGVTLGGTLKGALEFHGWTTTNSIKKGNTSLVGALQVGNAKISGDVKATLFKEGKFDPYITAGISASGSLLSGSALWKYEKEHFGVEASGKVEVGAIRGEANMVISKDEISAKANWSVAAVRGEVKGGINIFGFRVDATLGGEVLGVGGGAEFKKETNSFEIGGKLSFIFGLDFKIKISH